MLFNDPGNSVWQGKMSAEQEKEGGEGGGVRNTLVTSIATNIFDTLKSNDDIAAILNGVLDPARTDKVNRLSHHIN